MDVAILGSGPAGLLAALAVEQNGHNPVVFALGTKSEMFGAMYLHAPIPGLTGDIMEPDLKINIIKSGVRAGYAQNVYGDPDAPCSWDVIEEGMDVPAWDLHEAYDKLWDHYSGRIIPTNLENVAVMGSILHNFPLALCSIPAKTICRSVEHEFKGQEIWVEHGPARVTIKGAETDNIMYYNGYTPDGKYGMVGFEWYRFSQIKGYQAWEYSKPKFHHEFGRQISTGTKPLTTNCDCWTAWGNFVRIGRFGKWQKGVLTHHAYQDATEAIRNVL